MNTTKKYIVMKSYGSKIEMDSEHDSIKSAKIDKNNKKVKI